MLLVTSLECQNIEVIFKVVKGLCRWEFGFVRDLACRQQGTLLRSGVHHLPYFLGDRFNSDVAYFWTSDDGLHNQVSRCGVLTA